MTHLMLHGNVFGVAIGQTGARGDDGIVSTQMLMANVGKTFGDRHFLNLALMMSFEKWTLKENGYPLILQTGEANRNAVPYIDAQHPHNSPVMGLTLSDTIRLGDGDKKSFLKVFFAPRGQSTEGPIVFMHRPTGVPNPDAPLGHHIGQDVGHITSTVLGGALKRGANQIEASVFNGTEPEPDEVNLPFGAPNSAALRFTRFFSDDLFAMASIAYVDEPHPHGHTTESGSAVSLYDDDITHLVRYSLSSYVKNQISSSWNLYNTLIYGSYQTFGVATFRHSFSHEFLFQSEQSNVFWRSEVLQRVPAELLIRSAPRQLDGRWVRAFTLGYSHVVKDFGTVQLRAGASGTKSFVPGDFIGAYDGNPWSGKVFLQLSGMQMWGG